MNGKAVTELFWPTTHTRETPTSTSWLIVGLGNPGPQYEHTRHNAGRLTLNVLATRAKVKLSAHKTGSHIAQTRHLTSNTQLILAQPNGYMNTSGGPVSALMKYFNIEAERVIILHDELDLNFGMLKIKHGGGHGGHNGVRDITRALDTPEFFRIRIGIGRPPGRQNPADYVLKPFTSTERTQLPLLLEDAADATNTLISEGLLTAQHTFHRKDPR